MSKIFYVTSMAVMAAVTATVLYKFVLIGNVADTGADGRTPVILTEAERDYVLREMRGLIEGIIAMNEAALENDAKAMGTAAKSLGLSGEPSAETSTVMKKLPLEFKMMGIGLHKEFDRISDMANSGATVRDLQRALTDNMHKCVACHSSFKLVAEGSDY